jgi:predicted  nucleic acid-binding Zn-ribbon protein
MSSIAELFALQETDSALDASRASLEDIEARLGESEELVEAREATVAARDAHRVAEKAYREHEFEAEEQKRKIEPLEQKLYAGTIRNPKELEDLQQDVGALKRRRRELDETALEALEAYETAKSALEAAESKLQELEAAWQAEQGDLAQQRSSLRAEIVEFEEARAAEAEGIDPGLLALYDRLRGIRAGRAVVKIEGGKCAGCRISLPTNIMHRARIGAEVVQCTSCERILYVG